MNRGRSPTVVGKHPCALIAQAKEWLCMPALSWRKYSKTATMTSRLEQFLKINDFLTIKKQHKIRRVSGIKQFARQNILADSACQALSNDTR